MMLLKWIIGKFQGQIQEAVQEVENDWIRLQLPTTTASPYHWYSVDVQAVSHLLKRGYISKTQAREMFEQAEMIREEDLKLKGILTCNDAYS